MSCYNNTLPMYYFRISDKVTKYIFNGQLDYENVDFKEDDGDYERWMKIWMRINMQGQNQNNLLDSLLEAYRGQYFWGMTLSFLFYQFTILIPFLGYYIFENILSNSYNTLNNTILVGIVILLKFSKAFIRICSDRILNETGQGMRKILARAVLGKVLKVSLLSNKDLVSSELIKMMQIDVQKMERYPIVKSYVIGHLYSIVFGLAGMVYLFGFAGVVGILVLLATILLRLSVLKVIFKYEEEVSREANNRVMKTIDFFNIIKLIKVSALQIPYFNKLVKLRENQLDVVHSKNNFETLPVFAIMVSVRIVVLAVCLVWIKEEHPFSVAVLFTLNFIFINVNIYLAMINSTLLGEAKMALKSITLALNAEEIDRSHIRKVRDEKMKEALVVKEGKFYWDLHSENMMENAKIYLKNIDLTVKKGEFVSIIGRFGSGKSSLLNAILGQMKSEGNSAVTLNGSVAYVSQKPWIVNDTVRNNILFGAELDPKRYNEIIHYCALKADLEILSDGDQTLIGERGCTLSGGQKARVSLARALYSNADIYLLDDILSAVDAHVGSFIFFETLAKYLKGKTILLITHSLQFVQYSDQILVIDDCSLVAAGTFAQLKDHQILVKIETSKQRQSKDSSIVQQNRIRADPDFNPNAIVLDERDDAVGQFIARSGGRRFIIVTIVIVTLSSIYNMVYGFWMNSWANSPDNTDSSFINVYIILMIGHSFFLIYLYFYIMHLPILMSIYKDMVKGLLFTSLNYFEVTPIAKIIHRLSNDLHKLDKIVLYEYYSLTGHLSVVICYVFSVLGIFMQTRSYYMTGIFVLYVVIAFYEYRKYILTIKGYCRVEDELKIDVNSFFNEAVQGQAIIRAFDRCDSRWSEFKKIDFRFGKISNIVNGIDTIIKFFLSFSTTILISLVFIYYFYVESFSQFEVFLIVNLLSLEEYLDRINNNVIEFLVKLKSLSKCEELTQVPPESGYREMLSNWDEEGNESAENRREICTLGGIEFRDVKVRYKVQFGDVLRGVDIKIKGGEKIGIVGRTGSGKSTLFLALLRILEAHQGTILIDGVDISTVNLNSLRKNINFILQEHFLFPGTIRDNVDPSQEHTDAEIQSALQLCGLWSGLERREKLETMVAQGGQNLSVGERQLLNIARSLLNRKKIVLVDEATANIDIQTDEAIQKVLSSHFKGCTMLTIAHRINTILSYDRVLVLEQGRVQQFDSPQVLMHLQGSLFRKLYEQSSKMKAAA